MKALSLWQPWASLVAVGAKRFETRSWPTKYRGPLLICASKTFPAEAQDLCGEWPFHGALLPHYADGRRVTVEALPRGAAVAVAELARCLPTQQAVADWSRFEDGAAESYAEEYVFGDYSRGRWAWELRDVRRLARPVPCRGAMGLFAVPVEVLAALRAQGVANA